MKFLGNDSSPDFRSPGCRTAQSPDAISPGFEHSSKRVDTHKNRMRHLYLYNFCMRKAGLDIKKISWRLARSTALALAPMATRLRPMRLNAGSSNGRTDRLSVGGGRPRRRYCCRFNARDRRHRPSTRKTILHCMAIGRSNSK
jgi:hypothetical protein